ncbi:MAG: type III-B CRISPR module-associated protein Cmr5 [Desulfocapsaceae bacterium]|nr:type III-B CRISPR module-associated protein Cmr5 [Desulfocapsaceae bacterium]
MQTKEQKRSAFVLTQIQTVFHDRVDKETANFLVGVPTLILANGLAQSLAFLLSKKKEQKHKDTFQVIKEWLSREMPSLKTASDIDFLKKFADLKQSEYLAAQEEALTMLQWLKRYARAFEV